MDAFDFINNVDNFSEGKGSGGSTSDFLNSYAGSLMGQQNDLMQNNFMINGAEVGLSSPRRIYNERYASALQGIQNNAPYGTTNPATGLNTPSDLGRGNGGRTPPPYMFFGFLDDIYRENFLFRNAVDIPVDDLTREKRKFRTSEFSPVSDEELRIREEAEEVYEVQKNINLALKWARLYGGSAIVLGIDGQYDLMQPLAYEDIKKGTLRTMNVVFKDQIVPSGILDANPASPYYGQVAMYAITTWQASSFTQWSSLDGWVTELQRFNTRMSGITSMAEMTKQDEALRSKQKRESFQEFSPYGSGNVFVHRSRIIIFNGYSLPLYSKFRTLYWNDSILVPAWNVLDLAEQVWQAAAQLLLKANIDVIYSENFYQVLKKNNEQEYEKISQKIKRLASAYNFMFLDKTLQSLERKQLQNLGGVKDIVDMYLRLVSMAFRIPMAKMASGLNVKGMSDTDTELVLYYDFIKNLQSSISSELRHLDRIIECSLFGKPRNIKYEWPDLYSMSPPQAAAVQMQKAQTDLIYLNSEVLGIDDVREGLIEKGRYDKIKAKISLGKTIGKIDKDIQTSIMKEQQKIMPAQPPRAGGGKSSGGGGSGGVKAKANIPDQADRFKTQVQSSPTLKSQTPKPASDSGK